MCQRVVDTEHRSLEFTIDLDAPHRFDRILSKHTEPIVERIIVYQPVNLDVAMNGLAPPDRPEQRVADEFNGAPQPHGGGGHRAWFS